jgi:hypothetical protein
MIEYGQLLARLTIYIAGNYKFKKDFAEDMGVSRVFLSEVLAGKKKMPRKWIKLIGYEPIDAYKLIR